MKSPPDDFSEFDSFAARHHRLQILVAKIDTGCKMSYNLCFFVKIGDEMQNESVLRVPVHSFAAGIEHQEMARTNESVLRVPMY